MQLQEAADTAAAIGSMDPMTLYKLVAKKVRFCMCCTRCLLKPAVWSFCHCDDSMLADCLAEADCGISTPTDHAVAPTPACSMLSIQTPAAPRPGDKSQPRHWEAAIKPVCIQQASSDVRCHVQDAHPLYILNIAKIFNDTRGGPTGLQVRPSKHCCILHHLSGTQLCK